MPSTRLPAEIGERIGHYDLEEVIGRGGMGCVYLARHRVIGRFAAVKDLYGSLDATSTERFFREARIVNEVHHPNLVDIYDLVREEAPPRIACIMEPLPGHTLERQLRSKRPTVAQSKAIMAQLVSALSAVHGQGFVHRDLKPGNVMLLRPHEEDWSEVPSIKVLDFGIAKRLPREGEGGTHSGMMVGTPAYMAPEQIAGQPVSFATDVYALAELGYELLTGTRAFAGDPREVLRNKLDGVRPSLDTIPDPRLRAALRRALHPEPSARPSLEALGRRFAEYAPDRERRRAIPLGLVGLLIFVIVVAAACAVWLGLPMLLGWSAGAGDGRRVALSPLAVRLGAVAEVTEVAVLNDDGWIERRRFFENPTERTARLRTLVPLDGLDDRLPSRGLRREKGGDARSQRSP